MKKVTMALAAAAAFAFAPSAFAVDFCVGSTNGVHNFGRGNAGVPKCLPFGPGLVDQFVQDSANNGTFNVFGNVFSGPISAHLGRSPVHSISQIGTIITDRYLFTIPQTGIGSGSITTTTTRLRSSTDIDFISVDINGIFASVVGSGANIGTDFQGETASLFNVPITAFVQNILTITYRSRGRGSYGGDLTFDPVVPEPATWTLMLAGFGLMGFAMRRRRKETARVKFAL